MNFIQEVLNLLERKQDKKKLDINRDYFEFGRTKPSSIGNPLYNPKMTPHAIKYKDFKCETIKGLISGTGTEHTLPVWSVLDPANCNVQTVIDSVYSQDAGAQTGTVDANLTVNGDLLVLGKQTIIESTIVEIADNIIELNTQGADVDAGFSVGTVNGLKTFGWDATNLLWSTFKESLMTKDIVVNRAIVQDGETLVNVVNEAEGLASQDNDESLATVAAIIDWSDQMDLDVSADTGTPLDILLNSMTLQIRGGSNITTTADGTEKININLDDDIVVNSVTSKNLTLLGAPGAYGVTSIVNTIADTVDANATLATVKAIINYVDQERDFINDVQLNGTSLDFTGINNAFTGSVDLSSLSGGGGSVPVMTSTVTGTGKLWDDTVQVEDAAPVTAVTQRTYGVQFNDASQLVVNVPWVEGSGGSIVIGNPDNSPTIDLTSISIDGIVYGIASGGGGTVTAVDFTSDIAAFTATTVDGTTTPSISLDLNGGTAGQFLRQDGTWATIPGGNPGTVTDVSVLVNGGVPDAISLRVFDSTTTPRIELDFGGVADQYINGLGVLTTFPTINPGTVTSFSASLVNGDSLSVAVADSTSTPAANFTWGGNASEYVNGEGDLQPFPAIPSGTIESISTTWPSGADVAMTLTEVNLNGPGTQLNWDVQGTTAQYIDGTFKLQTFPTIPAVPFTSLTTIGTTGAATLTSGVLNIPEYTSGGTENCTFGMDIPGDGKSLTNSFVPIKSASNVVLGYENSSGVRTNYLNTISLTFETRSTAKTYDFEIRFEARVVAGVFPLQTYEDSFYSEGDKLITKTYTYYSPNLEDGGEVYVSARTLGIGDLSIKTSHIAVVSSSCEAITEGKVKQITV